MSTSENGWWPARLPPTSGQLQWVAIPGCDPPVRLQIQTGQPTTILRAFVADVNAYVERVRDADTACYTATNSVATSNHLNGTAVDIDWDSHAFHVRGTFGDRLGRLRELLQWYEGMVFWGGDWVDPIDEMHFQMGYDTCNNPKTAEFITRKIRADGYSTFKRDAQVVAATTTEKVLPYNHSQQQVAQEKFFDCCPASVQIVLDGKGVAQDENSLIAAIGTTSDGTNTVEQALPVLNKYTAGQYRAQWMPHDPPSDSEREALWRNLTGSINAGYGCVLNFEVPSSNFPRGTRGSVSPSYRGGKVWHYVACMGYADDGPGGRHLWIADPGFAPFGYWMSLEQAATAIPPHAYAYATAGAAPARPTPTTTPTTSGGYQSVSPYRTPGEPAVGGLDRFAINDDGMIHAAWVEYSAMVLGDEEAVARLVRTAAGHGASTDAALVARARRVLAKTPKEALSAVLLRVQAANPEWIDALRSGQ